MPFQIALFEPEIPPNTGNIMRLCANTGCKLHLIEPLGFSLDERRLRRAGLDYAEYADVTVHADWQAFTATVAAADDARLWAFTTHGSVHLHKVTLKENDVLLFGPEGRGLGEALLNTIAADRRVRLPMLPQSRSLNLANAVSAAVYEGWRQLDFIGGT